MVGGVSVHRSTDNWNKIDRDAEPEIENDGAGGKPHGTGGCMTESTAARADVACWWVGGWLSERVRVSA